MLVSVKSERKTNNLSSNLIERGSFYNSSEFVV